MKLFACSESCTCDACEGVVWPEPPSLSQEDTDKLINRMTELGRAAAKYPDSLITKLMIEGVFINGEWVSFPGDKTTDAS